MNEPFETTQETEAPYIHDNFDKAGFLSKMYFSHGSAMLSNVRNKEAKNQPMSINDCMIMPERQDSENACKIFRPLLAEAIANAKKTKQPLNVLGLACKTFSSDLLFGALCRLLSDTSMFVSPIILQLIIKYLKSPSDPMWQGFLWAVLLMIASSFFSLCQNFHNSTSFRFALNARNVLQMAVFEKALSLQSIPSTGDVLRMHTADVAKLLDAATMIHYLWSAPLLTLVFLGQLWVYTGWAGVAGFAVMVITIPYQNKMSVQMQIMKNELIQYTVKRIQITNELFSNIRIIKLLGWEEFLEKRIDIRRRIELGKLVSMASFRMGLLCIVTASPMLTTYTVFAVMLGLQGNITSQNVFPALAVLNAMRIPMMMLPVAGGRVIDVAIAMRRVSAFLMWENPASVLKAEALGGDTASDVVVSCKDVTMEYLVQKQTTAPQPLPQQAAGQKPEPQPIPRGPITEDSIESQIQDGSGTKENIDYTAPVQVRTVFKGVNLEVKKDKLILITGPTGIGKSTLVHALLGEGGVQTKGELIVRGSISCSTQESFIIGGSVRANILMGLPFVESKYTEVLKVCQLRSDIESFPDGDRTEIGEAGINLSGGQKQRINVARAVYADADVYIFDDPLSAVDAHVAHGLFHDCILKYLATKTRILVTHQLQFSAYADEIITIGNDGGISVAVNESPEPATDLITSFAMPKKDSTEEGEFNEVPKPEGILIHKEDMVAGPVRWSVFSEYLSVVGFPISFSVGLAGALTQMARQLSDLWISWWPERTIKISDHDYLIWWGITIAGTMIMIVARADILNTTQFVTSQKYHKKLIAALARAPTSFFDTTPMGRIMTLFTRDLDLVDGSLLDAYTFFMNNSWVLVSSVVIIAIATYYTAIVIVAIACIYAVLYRRYTASYRGLKQLEGFYRAPLISLLRETISGLTTIHTRKQTEWVRSVHDNRLKDFARVLYNSVLAQQWLGARLELLGTTLVFATALLAVGQRANGTASNLDISLLGLAIVYAMGITQTLSAITKFAGEIEASMNCIERIKRTVDETPLEKEPTYDEKNPEPHPSWPTTGTIQLNNVDLRYRDNLPLVLKSVTCTIPSGARVGIVGRTGSGKSTLLLALFRIVELSGGSISIDGRDISTLRLHDLRSKITVIPQDPVLFEGTIRSNLDPFDAYRDEDVWAALRKVNMEERIRSEKKGLRAVVSERGSNFSVGQRQLMCMARALLKKCRVLLVDEATASVDNVTDGLIQRTLRTEFQGVTVLTIAHRLLTVMDSDLVMVMKNGSIVEFGQPDKLLKIQDGVFSHLLRKQTDLDNNDFTARQPEEQNPQGPSEPASPSEVFI